MTISSRTPEGWPGHCEICGHDLRLEPSPITCDATCPCCGALVWLSAGYIGEAQSPEFDLEFTELRVAIGPGAVHGGKKTAPPLAVAGLLVGAALLLLTSVLDVVFHDRAASDLVAIPAIVSLSTSLLVIFVCLQD